jgi:3-oxoacyl-[acyl-carrier protein] reductase
VVLITGAASGIGAAVARQMAGQWRVATAGAPGGGGGLRFVLHTRANKSGLEAVAADVRAAGATAELVFADLAEPGGAASVVAAASAAFGELDLVLANAGFADPTAFEAATAEGLEKSFATMASSFLLLAQAALPLLRLSKQPRIVAVSSFIAHRYGEPHREGTGLFLSSAASKAALESMVKTLARVVAPEGIPVNIVAPGHIEKDKSVGTEAGAARRESVQAMVPMRRIGTPDDGMLLKGARRRWHSQPALVLLLRCGVLLDRSLLLASGCHGPCGLDSR